MRFNRVAASISALLLAGCGGGNSYSGGSNPPDTGGSVQCGFIPGNVNFNIGTQINCGGCTVSNSGQAADSNLDTYAEVDTPFGAHQTLTITDNNAGGPQFPAGSNAGAFINIPSGTTTNSLTFTTYLNGVAQDTATGSMLTVTPASPTTYVSFNATRPFDSIGMAIDAGSNTDYRIYEFCGNESQ